MNTITLKSIEPQLVQRIQQRASENGRTIEAEIATILSSVLLPEKTKENVDPEKEVSLATAMRQRFEPLGDFEIPEILREPIHTP